MESELVCPPVLMELFFIMFSLLLFSFFLRKGCIMGLAGPRKLYTTSNGGVTIRATTHIEVRTDSDSAGVHSCKPLFVEHCCFFFVQAALHRLIFMRRYEHLCVVSSFCCLEGFSLAVLQQ